VLADAPYVALPFDPRLLATGTRRVHPEVEGLDPTTEGFLLHPVSRSETWRRLPGPQDHKMVRRVDSKQPASFAPGAELTSEALYLADVPIWRCTNCESTATSVYLIRLIFSRLYATSSHR
jgi:hypothetical protein